LYLSGKNEKPGWDSPTSEASSGEKKSSWEDLSVVTVADR
jgi:hypothetical protein